MKRKFFLLIFMIIGFLTFSCIKETYDMNKLSKDAHYSPTMVISAIKGDISLKDLDIWNDTVLYDQSNLVKIIFKEGNLFDLSIDDFFPDFKGTLTDMTATFEPDTLNLEIEDFLSHLTGDFSILNPSIKISYVNSFVDPIQITLNAVGKRDTETKELVLAPFVLNHPVDSAADEVTGTFVINKDNSNLPEILSMPPEEIIFSGSALMEFSGKNNQSDIKFSGSRSISASLEVEVPLEFRMNNLQYKDTTDDNFLADVFDEGSEFNWDDFESFRIDFDVENGFPMEVSLNMSLFKSTGPNPQVLSSIDATNLLKAAPVDVSGRANGTTMSTTSILFTEEFFNSIDLADKIIFQFTLNTTDAGSEDVKIFSDYKINFKASLVMKPDFKFNMK